MGIYGEYGFAIFNSSSSMGYLVYDFATQAAPAAGVIGRMALQQGASVVFATENSCSGGRLGYMPFKNSCNSRGRLVICNSKQLQQQGTSGCMQLVLVAATGDVWGICHSRSATAAGDVWVYAAHNSCGSPGRLGYVQLTTAAKAGDVWVYAT